MQRIIIYDRHPVSILGFKSTVESFVKHIEIITCRSEVEVFQQMEVGVADMIILGLNEFEPDKTEFVRSLTKISPRAFIILFLPVTTYNYCSDYLALNVKGYFSKSDPIEVFLDMLPTILSGKKFFCSDLVDEIVAHTLAFKQGSSLLKTKLTERENSIARMIADGVKTSEITRLLDLRSPTISILKRKIFLKLGVNNVADLKVKMDRKLSPYS